MTLFLATGHPGRSADEPGSIPGGSSDSDRSTDQSGYANSRVIRCPGVISRDRLIRPC